MTLFKKDAVGIYIQEQSVEVVHVDMYKNKPRIKSAARVKLKSPVLDGSSIKNIKLLQKAITHALKNAKPIPLTPHEVICALPTRAVYTGHLQTTKQKKNRFEEAIAAHIQDTLPLDPDDTVFAYTVLPKKKKRKEVSLCYAATSKTILTAWHELFASLHIKARFDVIPLATRRTISAVQQSPTVAMVDMAGSTTTISVLTNGYIQYNYGRTFIQDENLVTAIAKEIKTALTTTAQEPEYILLLAAPKEARTIKQKLQKQLGIPVRVTQPWIKNRPSLHKTTVGLAMRILDETWAVYDPLLERKTAKTINIHAEEPNPTQETQEENKSTTIAQKREAKRLHKQKITLGILGILGICALLGAYWFRANEKTKHQAEQEQQQVNYTNVQSIQITLPLTTQPQENTNNKSIPGRIVTRTIDGAEDYREAVAKAKIAAEKEIKETEALWQTPTNEPLDTGTITFPYNVDWLIYNKEETDRLLLNHIKTINTSNIDYALNMITVDRIIKTTKEDSPYTLIATVKLSLNDMIQVPLTPETSSPTTTAPTTQTTSTKNNAPEKTTSTIATDTTQQVVTILETPTGWLNVRTGPGSTYPLLERITPGDQYRLIETTDDWYNIALSDNINGWVSATFVTIK